MFQFKAAPHQSAAVQVGELGFSGLHLPVATRSRAECMDDLSGTGKSVLRVFLQQPQYDLDQVFRLPFQVRTHLFAPVTTRATDRGTVWSNKWQATSQDLMQRNSEGVEVGSPVGSASIDDLGSHIVEGPLDGKIKGPGDLLCESEIDQLRARGSKAPVGRSWLVLDLDDLRCFIFANLSRSCHENVVWLDIEMDIALGMDVFQSPADLHDNIEKLLLLEGRGGPEKIVSANELTDDEPVVAVGNPAEVMHSRQVRVA